METPVNHCDSETDVFRASSHSVLWAYRLVRTTLGIIFVLSGLFKLIDTNNFATIIDAYGIIPQEAVLPAAFGLALLELVAGAGLISDIQWSLGIITGLLILFITILGYGLWLGLDIDCGCFGPEDPEGAAYHSLRPALYRDMIMLAGSGCLFFWRWRQPFHPIKFSTLYQILINIKRRK